jgi:hypothetical protein
MKWNATSIKPLSKLLKDEIKYEIYCKHNVSALFPAKGALPSLSTGRSLTQCILKMNNLQQKQNGNNRNRITETLTIFIEDEKDNTTAGRLSFLYSSILCSVSIISQA